MRSTLDVLFGSRTRAKVLRLLMTNPEKSYFVREIARKVHEHINSVRRELHLLTEMDLVAATGEGQKKYYRAQTEHSLFPELKALVFKGEVFEERRLLSQIEDSGRIYLLVLAGFFVNQVDAPTDILIVGSINRPKLERLMRTFQEHFDREIHYTVMTRQEFEYRHSLTDRFLYGILSGPMITVIDKRT
jgi:predicted transcriptional regulator